MDQIIDFLKSKGMSDEQIQGALDKVKEHVPNAENLINEHGADGILKMIPGGMDGITDKLHDFAEKIPGPVGDMLEGMFGHKEEAPAEESTEEATEETTEETSS